MTKLTLYHYPGACSRVTMIALERTGADFETHLVDIVAGEQNSERYARVNPNLAVPCLRSDDVTIAENGAILIQLARHYPDAALLPAAPDGLPTVGALQDLFWCSATLHPRTRAVRSPTKLTLGEEEEVRRRGVAAYQATLDLLERRFTERRWWYGERWSIIDAYLWWHCDTIASAGVDLLPFPAIIAHGQRVKAQAAVKRALNREAADLAAHGRVRRG